MTSGRGMGHGRHLHPRALLVGLEQCTDKNCGTVPVPKPGQTVRSVAPKIAVGVGGEGPKRFLMTLRPRRCVVHNCTPSSTFASLTSTQSPRLLDSRMLSVR